jgi:hypothetical protein
MGVLFSASLTEDDRFTISATPADVNRQYNVYEMYLGEHLTDSYWIDWGGWYDNPIVNQVELYIGQFLVRVNSLEDCCITPFSVYDEATAGTTYFNVPIHPWLYDDINITFRKLITFLSGAKDPDNPPDNVFNNERWPVRLEVPKFTVKLSDVISGLTKYSTFSFSLFNDDGFFDYITTDYFNTPAYIKKTWKDKPSAADFITIRYGLVESIKIDNTKMTVSCADLFRTLEEPISLVVADIISMANENQDEELPLIYGTVNIPLIKIDADKYLAGENITSVINVYDKDGNIVEASFNNSTKIITTDAEAEYATVVGNTNNKIGQIIVDLITTKTNIQYNDSFWDVEETNHYITNSYPINIALTGRQVKDAVKDVLVSDMAFLVQKNDGRFTLRKWGEQYNNFVIKKITKFPSKDYADAQKNYFSSCIIEYNYDEEAEEYKNKILFRDNEEEAEKRYNKKIRKTFSTHLINEGDAIELAGKLSGRFTALKEVVKISVGFDTSEINLLDTVELDLTINGRKFSDNTVWVVTEIDPAQDTLTLEGL